MNKMKKFSFTTVYVLRLSIDNVLGLVKSTTDLAIAAKAALSDMTKTILTQLIADKEKFEPLVSTPRKSELTDEVNDAHAARKSLFSETKRMVTLHLKGRDNTKKVAAQSFNFFITPYWNKLTDPMNTLTGILHEMVEKYKSDPELLADAKELGVDAIMLEIETANIKFNALYNQRLADEASRESSASAQKATVCSSYAEFSNALEQQVNFAPNEDSIKLFNQLEELRKKYQNLGAKGKDEPEPETPKA